eukprot:m.18872 g.18872  ORF g.18872 m.18872 type:complete len:130 (+) comp12247_c0_seq1:412-801(+)
MLQKSNRRFPAFELEVVQSNAATSILATSDLNTLSDCAVGDSKISSLCPTMSDLDVVSVFTKPHGFTTAVWIPALPRKASAWSFQNNTGPPSYGCGFCIVVPMLEHSATFKVDRSAAAELDVVFASADT